MEIERIVSSRSGHSSSSHQMYFYKFSSGSVTGNMISSVCASYFGEDLIDDRKHLHISKVCFVMGLLDDLKVVHKECVLQPCAPAIVWQNYGNKYLTCDFVLFSWKINEFLCHN